MIIFLILIFLINNSSTENIKIKNTPTLSVSNNNAENINFNIDKEEITKWKIEIESLNLKADITELEGNVPSTSVGHISKTSILGNNIALIAYNFGSENNYFANLKDLKLGDKITYIVNDKKLTYKVISNKIIEKDSLDETLKDNNKNENFLKLFTYVKDIDDKLRYVLSKRDN